jgi:hypothetical protein
MPKVSFRMAAASRESVFGAQTNTRGKFIGQTTPRAGFGPAQDRFSCHGPETLPVILTH